MRKVTDSSYAAFLIGLTAAPKNERVRLFLI